MSIWAPGYRSRMVRMSPPPFPSMTGITSSDTLNTREFEMKSPTSCTIRAFACATLLLGPVTLIVCNWCSSRFCVLLLLLPFSAASLVRLSPVSIRTFRSRLIARMGWPPPASRQPSRMCFSTLSTSSTSRLPSAISLMRSMAALTAGRRPTTSTVLPSRLIFTATPNSSCSAVMCWPPLPMMAGSNEASSSMSERTLCRLSTSALASSTL
mmetsp:Transcript_28819/g.48378  ORF Transcript_28819/g.48378 Transcript_28819/m.48378 type:complete len:211 (-) Transcript_28819:962-1594(-)